MWFNRTNGASSGHQQDYRLQMQIQQHHQPYQHMLMQTDQGRPSTSFSSSTYSSNSTSSLISSSTSVLPAPTPGAATIGAAYTTQRTMEEFWKDITLGASPNTTSCMDHQTRHHHISHRQDSIYQPHSTTISTPPLAGSQWHTTSYQCALPPPPLTLQDFLAAGTSAARQDSSAASPAGISSPHHQVSARAMDGVPANGINIPGLHNLSPVPGPLDVTAPVPTTTGLGLSSSFDLNVFYLDDVPSLPGATTPTGATGTHTEPATLDDSAPVAGSQRLVPVAVSSPFPAPSPFMDAIGSPVANGLIFPFGGGNKWSAAQRQQQLELGADAGDNRYKRRIKNRESAARSRARKQAYTNELEAEVAHLTEENSKLRTQNDEMRLTIAAQLPARKKVLQRSSTAPF